jgi:hypothetical protein
MLKTTPSPAFLSLLAHPLHRQGLDVSLALIMAILEGELTGEQRLVAVCKLLSEVNGPLIHQFTFIVAAFQVTLFSFL